MQQGTSHNVTYYLYSATIWIWLISDTTSYRLFTNSKTNKQNITISHSDARCNMFIIIDIEYLFVSTNGRAYGIVGYTVIHTIQQHTQTISQNSLKSCVYLSSNMIHSCIIEIIGLIKSTTNNWQRNTWYACRLRRRNFDSFVIFFSMNSFRFRAIVLMRLLKLQFYWIINAPTNRLITWI